MSSEEQHVIFVDDDPRSVESAAELLQRHRYCVEIVLPEEAISRIQQGTNVQAAWVLDHNMPPRTSVDLVRAIQQSGNPYTYVVRSADFKGTVENDYARAKIPMPRFIDKMWPDQLTDALQQIFADRASGVTQ